MGALAFLSVCTGTLVFALAFRISASRWTADPCAWTGVTQCL